jgi:hypothetical protein
MNPTLRSLLVLTILSALSGKAGADATVGTFAGNAQHTAVYATAAQDLNAIRWSTDIDLNTSGAFAHFGGPLITPANPFTTHGLADNVTVDQGALYGSTQP